MYTPRNKSPHSNAWPINHYQVTTYLKGHTERQKESSKKMQIEMVAINTIKTLALTNGREEIRRSPRRSGGLVQEPREESKNKYRDKYSSS